MLEFVKVKDNLLEFLNIYRNEIVDYDVIRNHLNFFSLPNGVVEACIEEMTLDKAIIIRSMESKISMIITGSGERLLSSGGYVKKLKEENILRQNDDIRSDTLYTPNVLYRRSKQITVKSSSINASSILSSVLFKRV